MTRYVQTFAHAIRLGDRLLDFGDNPKILLVESIRWDGGENLSFRMEVDSITHYWWTFQLNDMVKLVIQDPSAEGNKEERVSAEDRLMQQVCRMVSYEPTGFRDLLHILSATDVIELTRMYLDSKDAE